MVLGAVVKLGSAETLGCNDSLGCALEEGSLEMLGVIEGGANSSVGSELVLGTLVEGCSLGWLLGLDEGWPLGKLDGLRYKVEKKRLAE